MCIYILYLYIHPVYIYIYICILFDTSDDANPGERFGGAPITIALDNKQPNVHTHI